MAKKTQAQEIAELSVKIDTLIKNQSSMQSDIAELKAHYNRLVGAKKFGVWLTTILLALGGLYISFKDQ